MAEVTAQWQHLLDAVRHVQIESPTEAQRQEALQRAMEVGCASVPETRSCSITLMDTDDRFRTTVTHGELALQLDQVQYQAGDGPCLAAARHRRPKRIDEMARDGRWPQFARTAAGMGVLSSLSLPLADGQVRAALNFYGKQEFGYASQRSTSIALLVSRVAGILLGLHGAAGANRNLADPGQLMIARQQNERIKQARDVVMAEGGLTEGAAYHQLAVQSRDESRSLIIVAEDMLSQRSSHEH